MSAVKPLLLNLFEMNCVSHITHGLWRLPGNRRHTFEDVEYWTTLARTAEEAGFDAVFLADVVGAYDVFRGGPETALREGLQIPSNDPLLVVPAMAVVTEHLGFGVTFSTSYEPPFAFARRMSTLDHLTRGRVGWNVVTSYLPNAARNFGLADEIEHDHRYAIADEFMEVVYKLWEGSWDDDAVVADRDRGVYTDPTRVRYVHHTGEHFRVAGPHLTSPSPQRTPLVVQATASRAGIEFAGRHAELVFTGGPDEASVRRTIAAVREAAVRHGRQAEDVKFVVQASVVTGRTAAEVAAKVAEHERFDSLDGRLAHASLPFDPTAHPRDRTVGEALAAEGRLDDPATRGFPLEQRIADFLDATGRFARTFSVAGEPHVVVAEIERWLDDVGIDGINLTQHHSYGTLEDFGEFVVPRLRERGRRPEGYVKGQTMRERFGGAGPHLPPDHPGRRFAGGRGLRGRT
ncbi:NtaA/DmoA family FMN-dependent monooxygenase [Kineococcus endophyticus]|uniref:NtaA/DmoA family FMN-dependent monooxygenase n=1 Tax=Kineococcus endophyticus TaxID=1181883 RepID=A0ABV3P836_9ACTN